ncbi:MAG: S8 family serine peptidase, partial [Crocosphaera sp.]|uniref:cadherin-like domain-containing protein n=1 Tax=Crocosphaera sp. TaxID=2729996 RepID=UPI00258C3038
EDTDTLVLDYSTLPTAAVIWNDSSDTSNRKFLVGNAYGMAEPIVSNSTNYTWLRSAEISDNGTTFAFTNASSVNSIRKLDDENSSLTFNAQNSSLSQDGNKIAYLHGGSIYVRSWDDSDVSELINLEEEKQAFSEQLGITEDDFASYQIGINSVMISGDGTKIAYTVRWSVFLETVSGYIDYIVVANSDGTDFVRSPLRTNGTQYNSDLSVFISGDGSKIAWINDSNPSELKLANHDFSDIKTLDFVTNVSTFSLSEDGSKVAWYDSQAARIWVAPIDGTRLDRIDVSGYVSNLNFSFSPDGEKVAFYKQLSDGTDNYGLFVANTDGTGEPILIQKGEEYNSFTMFRQGLSNYVDIGVRYDSFDLDTGSGEIVTWGPSHVNFTNVEKFNLTGTIYGDELLGGNLEDTLKGNGGADTLKGGLGDDIYKLDAQTNGGSYIEDTAGNDTLILENLELSLQLPTPGIGGIQRDNSNLNIDVNGDGIINSEEDVTIINFLANSSEYKPGIGFIENVDNLTGNDIINFLNPEANQQPILNIYNTLTLDQGARAIINNTFLQVTDSDNSVEEITYTLSHLPNNGILKLDEITLILNSTFTQADIDNNLLIYEHSDSESSSDSFNFTVSDGNDGKISETLFNITLNPVNDDPILTVNEQLTLDEGAIASITSQQLEVTDIDNTPDELIYTLTDLPDNGILLRNSIELSLDDTFSQTDINNGVITYSHNGSETLNDSFSFTVTDGNDGNINETLFNITVNSIDDLPIVQTAIADIMVNEDAATETIDISNLFLDADGDEITISISNSNQGLVNVSLENNLLTLDYLENESGEAIITLTGTANGETVETDFKVTVNPVNDPPVAANAEIKGQVWNDVNGDGVKDPTEESLSGWTVYLDENNDGELNNGEISLTTDENGNYHFTNLRPDIYTVAQVVQQGWQQTSPLVDITTTAANIPLSIPTHASYPLPITEAVTETTSVVTTDETQAIVNFNTTQYIVNEDGTAITEIIVTRSGNLNEEVSATLLFSDGTAEGCGCSASSVRDDFNNRSLSITFNENETIKVIPVENAIFNNPNAIRIRNDERVEGNEYFTIQLTNTTDGANIGHQNNATVTIIDDETEILNNTTTVENNNNGNDLINLDDFWNDARFSNIKGQGFATVIIDTGADLDHSFFGPDNDGDGVSDRIVYQYDFADNDNDASDVNNHGSHVTSIIASSDNTYTGIASETDIIILKVFGDDGSGTFADLEAALQWVNDNADTYNIASVNLSLGDSQNWTTEVSRYGIGDELAAIASQNIVVAAAAGNAFYTFNST